MISGKKIVVVMPAYNAEKTLRQTWEELPNDLIDEVVLVDDASRDSTIQVGRSSASRQSSTPRTWGTVPIRKRVTARR